MKKVFMVVVSTIIGAVIGAGVVLNIGVEPEVVHESVLTVNQSAIDEARAEGYTMGYSVGQDEGYEKGYESGYEVGYGDGETYEFTRIADAFDGSMARYQEELDAKPWYDFSKPSNGMYIGTDDAGEIRTIVFASNGIISG